MGRHSFTTYGPQVAGGLFLYPPPAASTAFLHTMAPEVRGRDEIHRAGNGAFRTMTPVYLSTTSTRSRSFQSTAFPDFRLGSLYRSNENFTSSAVTSPKPFVHWTPGRRVKRTWVSSTCLSSRARSGCQSHCRRSA